MRHMIMIVSMFLVAQGTALADTSTSANLKVGPPPAVGTCDKAEAQLTECQKAVHDADRDTKILVGIVATCRGTNDDEVIRALAAGTLIPVAKPVTTPKRKTVRKHHHRRVVRHHPRKTPKVTKDGRDMLYAITTVPPGTRCPTGCLKFSAGLDLNRNRKLDTHEVTNVNYGARNGRDGHSAGTTAGSDFKKDPRWCKGGSGTYIDGYVDLNGNGKPDKGELTGHVGASCDLPASVLRKPHDGMDGRPGHDGTTVGLGSLVMGDLFWTFGLPDIHSSSFGLKLLLEHDWAEGSVGAGWSPGIAHGSVLTADFSAYVLGSRLGPRLGAELVYADINEHNQARYQLMVATPGVALRILDGRHWKMRAEAHALIGVEGTYSQFHLTSGAGASFDLIYGF